MWTMNIKLMERSLQIQGREDLSSASIVKVIKDMRERMQIIRSDLVDWAWVEAYAELRRSARIGGLTYHNKVQVPGRGLRSLLNDTLV